MLILLSPAKDLSDVPAKGLKGTTQPRFLEQSEKLVKKLKGMSAKKLGELMHLSDALSQLNQERYASWSPPFTLKNAQPAAFMFNGEAYRALDVRSLDADDLRFAQRHLRILSGLYGLLRPLDLVQPYRLEMGTKLSVGRKKDLYDLWGDTISDQLNTDVEESEAEAIINLASAEYFKAARYQSLKVNVITPVFKDLTANGYRVVMMYAKHQRGAMARYIIRHRILEPVALKRYTEDGYRYMPEESSATEWVFYRDTPNAAVRKS